MNKRWLWLFLLISITVSAFAQNNSSSSAPLPPPVTIEYSVSNTPQTGMPVEITIKVTPEEDIHAEISCLMPKQAKPMNKKGVIIQPFMPDNPSDFVRQALYRDQVILWVGPLPKAMTKELSFSVMVPAQEPCEFIIQVKALSKWGVAEKSFVINPS